MNTKDKATPFNERDVKWDELVTIRPILISLIISDIQFIFISFFIFQILVNVVSDSELLDVVPTASCSLSSDFQSKAIFVLII
jgi:hypothetical protein